MNIIFFGMFFFQKNSYIFGTDLPMRDVSAPKAASSMPQHTPSLNERGDKGGSRRDILKAFT